MREQQTAFKRTHFQVIGSTQDYLIENADVLLKDTDQVVITADEQTKGRGTANRMWASPPNVNIYATFGIKIPNDFTIYFDLVRSPAVMEIMALAVVKTLEDYGFKPQIKWRNDILVNGKKICGILCEARAISPGGVGLIGIGLNVNMGKDFCDNLDQSVTSMTIEAGRNFDKEQVFNCLANNVAHYSKLYLEKNFASCIPDIESRLAFIDKLIHVEDQFSKRVIKGICLGIDENGQLKVREENGNIQFARWGRIIKDELAYPEAFTKKEQKEAQSKSYIPPLIVYAAGVLGLGVTSYLFYANYRKNSQPNQPQAQPSISAAKSNTSTHSQNSGSNKQETGKRYFSTYAHAGSVTSLLQKPTIKNRPKYSTAIGTPTHLAGVLRNVINPVVYNVTAKPLVTVAARLLKRG